MIAHPKLMIARLRHDRFGASSERSHKLLDQLELEFEEAEAAATEAEAGKADPDTPVRPLTCRKPVRGPLPEHLPRERVVLQGPSARPCCGGRLAERGETLTETLEVIPCRWKVVQTVREEFSCRSCETITQPPAPLHSIAARRAGPNLPAMIMKAKFGQHLPPNRQSETFAREASELDGSTLADWVGACSGTLAPVVTPIRAHVMAGEAVVARRGRQDDGLPAEATGDVDPVPDRWADLPD